MSLPDNETLPLCHHGRHGCRREPERRERGETPEQRRLRLRREELASAASIVSRRGQYPAGSLIVTWAERELAHEARLQEAAAREDVPALGAA